MRNDFSALGHFTVAGLIGHYSQKVGLSSDPGILAVGTLLFSGVIYRLQYALIRVVGALALASIIPLGIGLYYEPASTSVVLKRLFSSALDQLPALSKFFNNL